MESNQIKKLNCLYYKKYMLATFDPLSIYGIFLAQNRSLRNIATAAASMGKAQELHEKYIKKMRIQAEFEKPLFQRIYETFGRGY